MAQMFKIEKNNIFKDKDGRDSMNETKTKKVNEGRQSTKRLEERHLRAPDDSAWTPSIYRHNWRVISVQTRMFNHNSGKKR